MLRSHYCENCEIYWPYYGNYEKCGVCEGKTERSMLSPIDVPEAEALIKEARADRAAALAKRKQREAFEEFYVEREFEAMLRELDQLTA